ncbi:SPOR domain-containing protein [Novosphingobium sp. KCTC 2891]|uniref:SPOR domain-containing protein n=1 Tax=Novosphingobium sp. KCTC 2891 TaxID=2989730 RepID=UPI002222E30B|nr:SPOR domain-containing protein [Novosphingobium sp. KCTC 2891]MCW1381285.1 SPOR domain-containing protein [Novosphingobium sp. KCTC 2891]
MMRRIARSPNASTRAAMALALLLAGAAPLAVRAAQPSDDPGSGPMVSRPVIQQIGGGAPSPGQALNSALGRLARDPRNLTALLDAGTAALQLGDTDAAVGFFSRANEVAPGNAQVKAQIGTAMLKADKPIEAIRAFDEAERAGADVVAMAPDRGLAYDLVGDNAAAQRSYQLALNRGPNDEVLRRYGLSLAIAGDRRAAEGVLAPLVQRQDRAAWRVRTFVMAITGTPDEAVSVAYASMPQDLAAGIAPYLRFMGRLTPAQQAAAANLGHFPRAADIGRDDPLIVQYAALHPRAPRVDSGLIPAGDALGGKGTAPSREKRRRPGREDRVAVAMAAPRPAAPVAVAAPPPPAPQAVSVPVVQPVPRPAAMASQPVVQPLPAPVRPQVQPQIQSQPQPVQAAAASPAPGFASVPAASAPTPGFDLARTPGSQPVQASPVQASVPAPVSAPYPARIDLPPSAPAPAPVPIPVSVRAPVSAPQPAPVRTAAVTEAPPSPADFRALFEGFKAPEAEQQERVVAVDITRIAPVRPRAPEPKLAARPAIAVPAPEEKGAKATARDAKGAAKDVKAKLDARGERPDAPTAVSRTTERDAKLALAEKTAPGAKGTKGAKDAARDAKVLKDEKDAKAGKGKAAAPSHPSRIWVQVLTGANRDLMDKEWRRLVKEAAVLKAKKPYITPWRGNFRLLAGPFESEAAAQDFVKALRKDGVSGFQWTSPAGQSVDTLPLK